MDAHTAPDKKELRKFGLIMGAMIVGVFGLLLPWLWDARLPRWPWWVGGAFAVWALAVPATLKPVYRGWMKVGHVLGWVNTRIILGVVYYLLFLPVAVVLRVLGKDPMARHLDSKLASYRVPSRLRDKQHLERPF